MKSNLLKHVSLVSVATALGCAAAFAGEYKIDPSHSYVGFTVKHIVSKVKGEFKDVDGTFTFDAKKPVGASGKFVVKTSSIYTNSDKRDEHLKSADFFDVQKFPEMTFSDVKIKPAKGKDKYTMTGNLTLHGVTKPVNFEVEYSGTSPGSVGQYARGLQRHEGKINRKDYGLTWNKALETGGLLVGEDVAIELQVEAIENKPDVKKQ